MKNQHAYCSIYLQGIVVFLYWISAGFGFFLFAQQKVYIIEELQDSYALNDHLSILALENNIGIEEIKSESYSTDSSQG